MVTKCANALAIQLRSCDPKQHGDSDTPPQVSGRGLNAFLAAICDTIRKQGSQGAARQNALAQDLDANKWLHKCNCIHMGQEISPCDRYNLGKHSSDRLTSLSLCLCNLSPTLQRHFRRAIKGSLAEYRNRRGTSFGRPCAQRRPVMSVCVQDYGHVKKAHRRC